MGRLSVLYGLLFISGFGSAIGLIEALTSRGSPFFLIVSLNLFLVAAAWSLYEILIRLEKLTQPRTSAPAPTPAPALDLILEELPIDDPVPEAVQMMAKRVQATLAKKTNKPVSIQSLKKVDHNFICRLDVDSHMCSFKVPVDQAENTSAWAEQTKDLLRLINA